MDTMAKHHLLPAIMVLSYITFALILSAYRTEKVIKNEFARLEEKLENLISKEYEPVSEKPYSIYEIVAISDKINRLGKKLQKRDAKYKNYTKTLLIRNRQNNEVISAISHEFKNPITTILGYCDTLIADENINANIRKSFLGKIANGAKKLSLLIDRLSLSIRLENKTAELKKSAFFITEIIEEAIGQLKQKYKQREIKITGNDRKIYADRVLMEVVFSNLIENALKYSELDIEIEIGNEYVYIKDKGLGLEEHEIENITKKFYRVNRNTWNSSLGLGLFIVKYILDLHSTYLKINSTPKEGSVFYFSI